MRVLRSRVVIIGAGPAGLVLAHRLGLDGIDSIVLERHSREYVERRVRAGLLEQGTAELLRQSGVGERLDREGTVHDAFELCFNGERHRISTVQLTGHGVCMYSQQEVVKDLIRARMSAGAPPYFGVDDVTITAITGDAATVHCTLDGQPVEIRADFVAGCDGFHGVSRPAIPGSVLAPYQHTFPFGWLGILAETPPVSEELVYNVHDRGFTLHSMRSPQLSRQYLQVSPDDDLGMWPDERIWAELHTRLGADDHRLVEGAILEKGITSMRAFIAEPMQHGRLFLAGDAAHVVPPTAAKGLNLAIEDARVLAEALGCWYGSGNREPLDHYSRDCLAGVWQAQEFSAWMTQLLHKYPGDTGFEMRLRQARLRHLVTSPTAARSFAESYVGLSRASTYATR
ncbi:MAG TPA: 4-hydroxybenzoate 3-monooxygenase [Pseudonocardiaceae bacterium]|jgi:p-hydroxybenzoate 3-monooxygenase|nr:4-hydroxybenzoate 3-monooxygenase [Pseudonocardiaceae bacterium]